MEIYRLILLLSCSTGVVMAVGGYTKGKQFMVSFLYNFGVEDSDSTANYLFISSEQSGTVTVEMAQDGTIPTWVHNYTLVPMSTITVTLPDHSEMPNKMSVERRGILVYSDVDISVYAMNDDANTTSADSAVILPVSALSKNYIIPAVEMNPAIGIAAVVPNTVVTITLQTLCLIDYNGGRYSKNSTIRETLGEFDVFQVITKFASTNRCDLGGTTVTADKPVAVFSGSSCYFDRTSGCDHVMQQVVPSELLGMRFIVPDLIDTADYRVRVVATAETTVFFNEHHKDYTIHNRQMRLDKGLFVDYSVPDGTELEIFSDKVVSVTQFDGSNSPFSIPIPSVESYGWNYTITTMNNPSSKNFISYVNLVVHRDSAHTMTIDGKVLHHTTWRRVRDLGYSIATVPISAGSHRIAADDHFMVIVYGFDGVASYGYQAGYYLHTLPSAHLVVPTYVPTVDPTATTPPHVHCRDSPGTDCKVLDSILSICKTPDSPTHFCRKFCGYCQDCGHSGCSVVG